MSRDSISENSIKSNKINKVNSKNLGYYSKIYNNTVLVLNLVGYAFSNGNCKLSANLIGLPH